MSARLLSALAVISVQTWISAAAAVEFRANGPFDADFGWQRELPADFGRGEFTLEVRFRPDDSFPVGPTRPQGSPAQRKNWADADVEPYSDGEWWYEGNFLLDGHNNDAGPMGTFSLQFYGGGRLRWLFGDGTTGLRGDCWSIGAHPAVDTPSLLDGNEHWAAMVRRYTGDGADLELWIDGERIAVQHSSLRTDLQTFWDGWTPFTHDSPGWFWGSERQVASRTLEQYEDFKGGLSELRFWSVARSAEQLATIGEEQVTADAPGLVGHYTLPDSFNDPVCNALTGGECIALEVVDDTWRFSLANRPPIDWALAFLALAAASAAYRRASAERRNAHGVPARLWRFAAAVLAVTAWFTLLDIPTLIGQTTRTAAHAQGWYAMRKPLQVLAVCVVAAALGYTARRMLSSFAATDRATRFAAVTALLLTGLLLVRSASWHLTDQILELGPGPFTLERAAEAAAAIAIAAFARRTAARPMEK